MRGNATSTHHANSQQVTRSQAESTRSATTTRRRHDKAGTSRPQNKTTSGRTTRLEAPMKLRKRKPTEDALKPSRKVFNRLGRNRDEDMHTHLEARRNSATSRRREDLLIVSSINDEINELRARLEKLAARNTEVAPSTSSSPLVRRSSRSHCLLDSEYQLWQPTRERPTLKTIWMPSMTRWTCPGHYPCPLQMFCSHAIKDSKEVD